MKLVKISTLLTGISLETALNLSHMGCFVLTLFSSLVTKLSFQSSSTKHINIYIRSRI